MTSIPRRITATDGVTLAVHEWGDPAAPTVLAVHGYPDNHTVWTGVAELLAATFHVVAYDVRGSGESDRPGGVSAYRMDQLVADLVAVLDAVSPDEPVHLLGHDWGSIQCWPAVADERLRSRIATFTSISGPSLDHGGVWLRGLHEHPTQALRQIAHSYYTLLFQLPGLPELAARAGLLDRAITVAGRKARSSRAVDAPVPRSQDDEINGLALYRANIVRRTTRSRPRRVRVPVQVIVPAKDPYITAAFATEPVQGWVDDLSVEHVAGGHWVVSERPDVIARLVEQFIAGRRPHPRPHTRSRFAGRLVVVTGGARGIGRATSLEFARNGADVIVADVNDVAAQDTVDELRRLGVQAWAEHLDVSNLDEWTAFATTVRDEHGVPDVVVNNAGIGMGGSFLGTSTDDWRRILDVNLWGVIHGSRLFAAQLVERGQGGQIINVASAAAFSPSVVYPAYATTKAAVLMLTECLRAELACESIGVTAVCPGFIDTDISRTTVHVGVDEAEAARRRDHQIASYRRRNYSPERVATQIVRAAAADRPVAVITPEARLFRAVSRVSPSLMRRIATLDLNKL